MAKSKTPERNASAPPAALDDAAAFRAAVRDVKPLTHTPVIPARKPPKSRVRRPVPPVDIEESMPLLATPLTPSDPAATPSGSDVLSFQRTGVRPQYMRRLRRGLIPIEGELDLHGLSQAAARSQLAEFLAIGRGQGWRCVRIIHGKGYRSGSRGPVLKMAVDLWLRRQHEVLAFTSARAIDGGTGAVYVMLRA